VTGGANNGNANGNGARRKVAVFSGNRAEYGLQFPILKALAADPRLQYYLLVSGAHLRSEFGRTVSEIEKDGFDVYEKIPVEMPEDSLLTTASAIGSIVLGLTPVLARLRPDFLIVYGDRFESFAAGIAGTQMAIPTVHIEGGDYTEGGALDDSVRHAMTKLAHLHFTTNEQAAERVRCLGEERWRVFNVGYPALDLIKGGQYASPTDVYERFRLDPNRPIVVFTQHSVATEFDQAADQVRPSLEALERAGKAWGCQTIITWPNDDAGGRRIVEEIARLDAEGHPFIQVHRSLGRHYYHGVLNVASACVGNSSSGIKETPAFHCPCIDIGSRQRGRLRGTNVINVGYDAAEILRALETCLFDAAFRAQVRACLNPYGAGNAGQRIADVLATIPVDRAFVQKQMTY
jgi:UDP-N-acetylglucosamine 2-epimerase (non-hydrolysing)/GDP/UDP-N,N'-diacetylbacillosamine 2-epimerase (hydrolysing)